MEKTGVNNVNQKHFTNFEHWEDSDFIILNFIENDILNIIKMADYFNCNKYTCLKHCRKLNIPFLNSTQSSQEKEIVAYIKSIYDGEIITSDRSVLSPLELDIYLPEHNVAFEFNGLYWHSYGANNVNDKQYDLRYMKNRHRIKTQKCKEQGIQLFHIFENEWETKKDIWKSQISNAIKVNTRSIGARKCKIMNLTSSEVNTFLEENHLQGRCVSKINLALIYEESIVSIMTFGKSRYDKNIDYELLRFCSSKYTQVPGAASRLLKHFEKVYDPKGLVSYANARWSNGHLYRTIGFTYDGYSNPNYFYFKPPSHVLYSRVKFQKHKLEKQLFKFDPELTEMQNMVIDGYRAIYDSGNYKFTKYSKNKK